MPIKLGNVEVTVDLDKSHLDGMVVMNAKYLWGVYSVLSDMISSEITGRTYY